MGPRAARSAGWGLDVASAAKRQPSHAKSPQAPAQGFQARASRYLGCAALDACCPPNLRPCVSSVHRTQPGKPASPDVAAGRRHRAGAGQSDARAANPSRWQLCGRARCGKLHLPLMATRGHRCSQTERQGRPCAYSGQAVTQSRGLHTQQKAGPRRLCFCKAMKRRFQKR